MYAFVPVGSKVIPFGGPEVERGKEVRMMEVGGSKLLLARSNFTKATSPVEVTTATWLLASLNLMLTGTPPSGRRETDTSSHNEGVTPLTCKACKLPPAIS